MAEKVKWVCSSCGETSIYWEATVYWDEETQSMEIGGDFDEERATNYCGDCGGEDTGKKEEI